MALNSHGVCVEGYSIHSVPRAEPLRTGKAMLTVPLFTPTRSLRVKATLVHNGTRLVAEFVVCVMRRPTARLNVNLDAAVVPDTAVDQDLICASRQPALEIGTVNFCAAVVVDRLKLVLVEDRSGAADGAATTSSGRASRISATRTQ